MAQLNYAVPCLSQELAVGNPPETSPTPTEKPSESRLDSWKEIAAYLNRDVTTVQRWEKREGMPVHRHLHDRMGSVYGFCEELDAWRRMRQSELVKSEPGASRDEDSDQEPGDAQAKPLAASANRLARRYALLGIALVAVLSLGYFLIKNHRLNPATPKISSLAVLPLENLSADSAQEYLADGMTEALIGRLAMIGGLRVISRTSVTGFKNTKLTIPQIAQALHVDAVVEGSVIRDGNRIRVHVQLIRAATDEHLWSESYDREFGDVLALQSDVAQSIAEKVEATVTGEERERLAAARAIAPEVYESYLKGWFILDKSYTRTTVEESMSYFQDAIKRDPTFAPAYVGLADASSELATNFIGAPPKEMRRQVIGAARKAIELDPNLAEAHIVLANALQEQWRWADAEVEYRRALELSPNDANAHNGLAWWLLCQGRTSEALAWAQRGRELDPLAVSGTSIGWILFQSRRYDEAARELRAVLAVKPESAGALWDLGFVLVANNQPADAIPVLEKAVSVSNRSPAVIAVLIGAYAHAGRRGDALRLLAELKNRRTAGYLPAAAFVNAYLGLGDNKQAFFWLEQAYEEQSNILQFLKVHPFFDPIRDDPRFKDLLRRVGLT